ncbi:hypothetical protein CEXT_191891 [Caerostris extrusa]|uniref:Uncharacterized protein n=1 Tax=Caerostris extrusa TaxID=172846 RepID=A0AAV4QGB2_CAEEX|nr:hypothetical protein CEXT_191891 [Caerostris extrusa]
MNGGRQSVLCWVLSTELSLSPFNPLQGHELWMMATLKTYSNLIACLAADICLLYRHRKHIDLHLCSNHQVAYATTLFSVTYLVPFRLWCQHQEVTSVCNRLCQSSVTAYVKVVKGSVTAYVKVVKGSVTAYVKVVASCVIIVKLIMLPS